MSGLQIILFLFLTLSLPKASNAEGVFKFLGSLVPDNNTTRFWEWKSRSPDCSNRAFQANKIYNFPHNGYWMKAMGDRYITYTSWGGYDGKAFDLENNKQVPFSNGLDPFPTQDGLYYIHPEPIRFIKPENGLAKQDNAPNEYRDKEYEGSYQSVGMPVDTNKKKVYRVILSSGRDIVAQDYTRTLHSNGTVKFTERYPKPKRICKHVNPSGMSLSTPILSNKGNMLSAQEYNSDRTKIYKINPDLDTCEEVGDLGSDSNKTAFSFDDKYVAFISRTEGSDFRRFRLYLYDVTNKKTYQISTPSENVLYQGFRKDGMLMYTRSLESDGHRYQDNNSELVFVDPKRIIADLEKESKQYGQIGRLWAERCDIESISDQDAQVIGARMNIDACLKVVPPSNFDLRKVCRQTPEEIESPVESGKQ